MGRLQKIITSLHTSTDRNYISRMNDDKINCMIKANKFDHEYWDGNRRYGYGGYKHIPGRWKLAADKLIMNLQIKSKSKILDAGCEKVSFLKKLKI